MAALHGKTVLGVLKEFTVFAIVYHLVRLVMCPSATLQHIGVARISVLEALWWLDALSTGIPLEALVVNPTRPYRVEPRLKKRRPKPFPLMITPRQALRQQLVQCEQRLTSCHSAQSLKLVKSVEMICGHTTAHITGYPSMIKIDKNRWHGLWTGARLPIY